jgi:hypothetical protein
MGLKPLLIYIALFVLLHIHAKGQIAISGMVVDSVTMDALPATTIRLKKAKTGTTTNDQGFFSILSPAYDTLIISRIGYETLAFPFFSTEKDILILIREQATTLKEVVVNVYGEQKVLHSAPRQVRTMNAGEAFSSPFTYFSKTEKEKRMLARLQVEQQKVQVFLDLITRPQFKAEITDQFSISEEDYYDMLIKFNTENKAVHYLKDPEEIKKRIIAFFGTGLAKSKNRMPAN